MAIQGMAFLPADVSIHPGDTVKWVANSAEIHTVTFLATGDTLQPYNPATDAGPSGPGGSYDGISYYNSGIFATHDPSLPTSYSLTFPDEGDFTYYCLVHGEMMKGMVHVTTDGSTYRPPRPTRQGGGNPCGGDRRGWNRAGGHEGARGERPHRF